MEMSKPWPILKSYGAKRLGCIAMPIGGIGTGSISLGGRGDLRDWELVNRPAKDFVPRRSFFALRCKVAGKQPVTRALEGLIPPPHAGWDGEQRRNHGLPRFRNCRFEAAYPFGRVVLSDPDVPVEASLEAFNPFIPGNADASGIPVVVLRVVLVNKTGHPIEATICGSMQNFIGSDGAVAERATHRNEFKTDQSVKGIVMTAAGLSPLSPRWGSLAICTTSKSGVSYRLGWDAVSAAELLDFWEDLDCDGALTNTASASDDPAVGSLAVAVKLSPGQRKAVTFLLTWHFPNRQTWNPPDNGVWEPDSGGNEACRRSAAVIGNYYTGQYADAWDCAIKTAPRLNQLEAETRAFVSAFCDSSLPDIIKEAALFNLSTLKTQTCFRTPDGRFFGFEGSCNHEGCCYGSANHVWNHEQALAVLFGDLSRTMREVSFAYGTDANGCMSFRTYLPLSRAKEHGKAAADGQMGMIMKLYRDWQLSGDDAMLKRYWPAARKSLEFCWVEGGWDADRDGVMEGAQHNTLDVEYFGPNPLMACWYLGALRAAQEMAGHLGQNAFAAKCRRLFENGRQWVDTHLFNGEYYEHHVRPIPPGQPIADGLLLLPQANDPAKPRFQLGKGCYVEQLSGQLAALVYDLGYLLDRNNLGTTLKSILKYNWRKNCFSHFNQQRTYMLNDEAGLIMISYPKGGHRDGPMHANEVMTGFEYVVAAHLCYEGRINEGVKCIRAIRDRYDGQKRNPFCEIECGYHYARALSSWAPALAISGFRFSAVNGAMQFAATSGPGRFFWSNGSAWGTCTQNGGTAYKEVEISVRHGQITLRRFALTGFEVVELEKPRTISTGKKIRFRLKRAQSVDHDRP